MVYDGEADSRAFHRFITEGTAYVKDGRVRSKARVFTLSRFRWRLPDFFTELFNHCFPVNFRTEFYELSELWNMIGDIDERQRVDRLWFGLKLDIQRELWMKGLNPEISSFNDVLAAAEIIEISHSVPVGRDRRGKKDHTHLESSATTPENDRKGKGLRKRDRRKTTEATRPGRAKDQRMLDKNRPKAEDSRKPHGSMSKRFEPLPKEEHDRLAAEGKCFRCKQPGKPPGVSSYGIHVDFGEVNRLRELADATEPGTEVYVGAMAFAEVAPPSLQTGEVVQDQMGDPLGERARILLSGILYPGDVPDCPDVLAMDRFYLYQVSEHTNCLAHKSMFRD